MHLPLFGTSRRTLYYRLFLLTLTLVFLRLSLNSATWFGAVQLHSVTEFVGATIALFTGVLTLFRFYTRRDNAFLFIGIGFLGAGALDAYHAMMTSSFYNGLFPLLRSSALPWSWNASPLFLSLLSVGSWVVWRRESGSERVVRILYAVTALFLALALLAFFSIATANASVVQLGQIQAVIAALFFLIALAGYLVNGQWREQRSDESLVYGLIISAAAQGLFMSAFQNVFDPLFTTAVILKQVGYVFVLAGLLGSMHSIFKGAQSVSIELSAANTALQHEIAQRREAEQAANRQRQLAEALRESGVALSAALEFADLLDALLDQIGRVLSYDQANVVMITQRDNVVVSTRVYGQNRQESMERLPPATLESMQEVVYSKQPLVIPDTQIDSRWTDEAVTGLIKSWASAPVVLNDEVVALLTVSSVNPNVYQTDDAAVLAAFASQAAIAVKNARLYSEVQQHVEQLTLLNQISQQITATLDVREALRIATERILSLLGADAVSVVLHDKIQRNLWCLAASGVGADTRHDQRRPLTYGLVGWVIANGQPVLSGNVEQDPRYSVDLISDNLQPQSALLVPLHSGRQILGAIEALDQKPLAFDENDLQILSLLAGPTVAAIENARLYEKARKEIADRKRAEENLVCERAQLARRVQERTAELQVANAELARAARLKDEFLASMSHELRTPLNTILGMVEVLQEEVYGPLNEKQRSSLQWVNESGNHLLSLIGDILDVSKIEAGMLELELLPVSVSSVCEASIRFIKREAQHKRLEVHLDMEQAPEIIFADERRLKQILVNLLSNAVKFTHKGGQIGLQVFGDIASESVNFTIWDEGIGVAPEEVERLFKPFIQLDSRLSREYSGTGLGLALVYRLTQLHKGRVSVVSEVGTGSEFTVRLPWQREDSILPDGTRLNTLPSAETPTQLVAPDPRCSAEKRTRVLLAEDNEATAATVNDYLSVLGYEVIVARNGREAVTTAMRQIPDIILMDVAMPEIDGLEAIRQIQAKDVLADTPIIAVTALAMSGDRERCLEAGAVDYMSKPISLTMLVKSIERYTSSVRRRGATRADAHTLGQ